MPGAHAESLSSLTIHDRPVAVETVETIFLNARQHSDPVQRQAYLADACAGDSHLLAQVEGMLNDASKAEGYFEGDQPHIDRALGITEAPGTTIGRYTLVEIVGEGGMGVVYRAEQREPVVRQVALKIVKLGMDTRAVVARFEAERQALALMDHPNIAKVLDGGATDSGRPYFVMELVNGQPITRFCDQAGMPIQERLLLFLEVCSAIQHAHQKGIIHRDIKPTNILIAIQNDKAVAKVIDFGVAKAMQQRLTDKTLVTHFQQFVGTPAYMSPEQASLTEMDIDTRSDIYSLGVLLYELLTGKSPFNGGELPFAGFDAMRRSILETEPVRPSTRLGTLQRAELASIARERGADAQRMIDTLRRDLDWIVLKCLEKDRARRYASANGLLVDVQRYLNDEPIVARPPSVAYRFRKAVKRNRLAFATVAGVTAALMLGLVVSSWQALRAARAEREQSRLRQEAQSARDQESILRQHAQREARRAEEKELTARRYLYDSQMKLAHQAILENRLGRTRELLEAQRPSPGQQDLRGWEWQYLWRACRSDELRTLCKHDASVGAVALSPDQQWIVSGDDRGMLKVTTGVDGAEISQLSVDDAVQDMEFSPAGDWLAIAAGPRLRLRSPGIFGDDCSLAHPESIHALAFLSDGRRIATAWGDQISIWDVASRQEIDRFAPLAPRFTHELAFSPDNRTLAVGLGHGEVCLWNITEHARSALLPGHRYIRGGRQVVTALTFSPDGAVLVSGGWDKTVKVWGVLNTNLIADIPAHGAWVSDLAFSPNGKLLASVSADQTVKLWDTGTWRLKSTLKGHTQPVLSVAFSPDSRSLTTCGEDGAVKVWPAEEAAAPISSLALDGGGHSVTLSEDGEWLYGEARGRSFVVVETASMKVERYPRPLESYYNCAIAPGGKLLAFTTEDGLLVLCRRHDSHLEEVNRVNAHPGKINYHVFSGDGAILATVGADQVVRFWRAGELTELRSFKIPDSGCGQARFSPDGRWFAIGHYSGWTRVWEWQQHTDFLALRGAGQGTTAGVVFFNGGRTLVTASYDGAARTWRLTDGEQVGSLRGNFTGLSGVDVSPDGHRLAAGTLEGTIILWNLSTGQELLTLSGHREIVSQVRFAAGGNTLVTASQDSLFVWRTDPPESHMSNSSAGPDGR